MLIYFGTSRKLTIPALQSAGKQVLALLLAWRDPEDSGFFELPFGEIKKS